MYDNENDTTNNNTGYTRYEIFLLFRKVDKKFHNHTFFFLNKKRLI